MKPCAICGNESKSFICPECQESEVTDKTRNTPGGIRYKRFWVNCPVCGRTRALSYTNIYNHFLKVSSLPPLICKRCSIEITHSNYVAGKYGKFGGPKKQRGQPTTIETNGGCIIQQTESGRCEEDCPMKQYQCCLDMALELGWEGFKRVGPDRTIK